MATTEHNKDHYGLDIIECVRLYVCVWGEGGIERERESESMYNK